jgi:membrane protein YqaA with SNARE-associated domain
MLYPPELRAHEGSSIIRVYNERVHSFVRTLFVFFLHLGAFGLLTLGVLDSSFLFLPLGNDLLLVALTVRHHSLLPIYVAAAAGGSTLGCYVLDLTVRKRGGAGIRKILSAKRLEYVETKVEHHAAAALLIATLAPPPFPFTTVIAAVSALHYPRGKMLGVIAGGRVVRFTIVGLLAIWLGRHLMRFTRTPAFEWSMAAFIALCVIGSAISIYKWISGAGRTAAP